MLRLLYTAYDYKVFSELTLLAKLWLRCYNDHIISQQLDWPYKGTLFLAKATIELYQFEAMRCSPGPR